MFTSRVRDAPSKPHSRRGLGSSTTSHHHKLNHHRSHGTTTRWVQRAKASGETDGEPSSTSSNNDDEENASEQTLDAAIFALALPAVASLLLDPVLGVVDTAFVGRIQGEGAAAALGGLAVSTAVFNFSFKLFNFLAVVTGPLVASQIAQANVENDSKDSKDSKYSTRAAAADTVQGAMTIAVVLGVSACVALELGADSVLRWAGGDGLVDPTGSIEGSRMMTEAESYLRVRALSAPAALIGTVAVGAYRGLLDTKTPLLVSGAANVVNLVLDPILIFGLGPVPAFGVAGAAAATTTAEWIAAVVFWQMLVKEGLLPGISLTGEKEGEKEKETETETEMESDNTSPDGIGGWFTALKPLAAGSASQLIRTLLLQAVLVRATAEAAGAGAAGAHQICIQVWWVTLFALDALAVAAQSLVAASLGAGDVISARNAADRSLKWALAAGTAVGVGIYAAGPLLPALFTDDVELVEQASGPLQLVALLQPLNAAVFVGDGVLQGAADFDYLAVAMAASATPALVLLGQVGEGVEAAIGAGASAEVVSVTALTGVWQSMSALQLGRAMTLSWRYFWDRTGPVTLPEGTTEDAIEDTNTAKQNGE